MRLTNAKKIRRYRILLRRELEIWDVARGLVGAGKTCYEPWAAEVLRKAIKQLEAKR